MPLYKTSHFITKETIGIFQGQRPSTAANKAFTKLRRSNKDLIEETIDVITEGHKHNTTYTVKYTQVNDPLLGIIMRPIATKTYNSCPAFSSTIIAESEENKPGSAEAPPDAQLEAP